MAEIGGFALQRLAIRTTGGGIDGGGRQWSLAVSGLVFPGCGRVSIRPVRCATPDHNKATSRTGCDNEQTEHASPQRGLRSYASEEEHGQS